MKRILESKIVQGVLTGIITTVSLALLWLMVDVRDFVKYRQPQRDEQQDVKIDELKRYFNQRCKMIDSLNSNKVQNLNKRMDGYKDDILRIENKIDRILLYKNIVEK